MNTTQKKIVVTALFAASILARAEETPAYETGLRSTIALGLDLREALKPEYKEQINPQPVSIETDVMPFVKTVEYPDETKPLNIVFISVGFIDLMRNVAHAKAIDKVEKGYFKKYVLSLAQESGEISLQDLPNLSDKRFWSDDVMNEQRSNYDQMVGTVLAIELSHHYLGNCKKYVEKMSENPKKAVPVNNLLTASEWDQSVKAGTRNALDAGFGVEGIKALYDCIDAMPKRPSWTAFFLPDAVKVSKTKKDLEKIEKDFFAGK